MNAKCFVVGLALVQSVAWADMLPKGFEGWTLNRGLGENTGAALMVEGDGKSDSAWLSKPLVLSAGETYRLRFRARSEGAGGGTVVSGIPSVNVDIGIPGETWTEYEHVFVVPGERDQKVEMPVRLGQWMVKGKVFFEDVSVVRVLPAYNILEAWGIRFGEGERIDGTTYTFSAPFDTVCRNHSRPFDEATATYNSNRWCLSDGTFFTYSHRLVWQRWARLLSAQVEITCGYYQSGRAVVEASKDRKTWHKIAVLDKVGSVKAKLPPALFPPDPSDSEMLVRVRGEGKPCSLQIHGYTFTAEVDKAPQTFTGLTRYFEGGGVTSVGDLTPGGTSKVVLAVDIISFPPGRDMLGSVVFEGRGVAHTNSSVLQTSPRTSLLDYLKIPYKMPGSGTWEMVVRVDDIHEARTRITVPEFYDEGYGELLPCADEGVALWRASSGWKIPRSRRPPVARTNALEIKLARSEWEATQLVVAPKRNLSDVRVSVQGLEGLRAEVLRVGYVPVSQRTDPTGVLADWPDPLLPQAGAFSVEGGKSQPFWIRVHAPKGARAGLHRGVAVVEADGMTERVPLNVEVYDFTLPDTMTCETAFGFNPQTVWRYHNVQDEGQRREVLGKYLRTLADHRISIYDPAPMDRWSVTWTGLPPWNGGVVEDGALVIRDTSETVNVSAEYKENFAIPEKGVKIAFKYKTEHAPGTLFTLRHFRADGSWMSGRNADTHLPAAAEWTPREVTVTQYPEGAAAFNLTFWGAGWQDAGTQTGTTRIKDVSVVDLSTGKELIAPTALAPFDAARAEPVFDWTRWDAAMMYAFTNYHFNSFSINVAGLGGGTFHRQYAPTFMGYTEDQPEYDILLGKYLKGIEAHLREKGWLDKAYVYWFDEPEEKDYAFVMNGFAKLKKHAPGLRRMLTEKVAEGLVGGSNLWCPLTPHINMPLAESRRNAGDQFWWYVCCVPKAPYVTEFIDHPGTEMRLWLWQTWQERVSGILIWETVYWTSSAAYPDPGKPQNPYLDPMCWVSDYEAQPGTRIPWGNGDGRFLYPPLAAADGRPAGPVLDAPVDSYRLEMLRDGIEDYEYFVILKKLLAEKKGRLPTARYAEYEKLLTVPQEVSTSLTSFTRDPAPMERHRERLARAIETLSKN